MKAVLSLLALAASTFAQKMVPRHVANVTTELISTTTTVCPVTSTQSQNGTYAIVTYLTTSVIIVPETVQEYVTLAPETTSIETWVYETSTSLCPVTEISTVAGAEVTVVYTYTSLIVKQVATTIVEYTTALTTCYETTEVYTTTTCYETDYTTVSAGSTIVLTVTETNTVLVTSAYTITSTLEPPTTKATVLAPITLATSVPETEFVTVPSERTATSPGGTVLSTIPVITISTVTAAPSTVLAPPTTVPVPPTTVPVPASTSTAAPLQVSANAAATHKPIAYAVAGAMALLALA